MTETPTISTTIFKRYVHESTNKQIFAAKISELDLEEVRIHWDRPDINENDFIILKKDGRLIVVPEETFLENHRRPRLDEPVQPQHNLYKGEKR